MRISERSTRFGQRKLKCPVQLHVLAYSLIRSTSSRVSLSRVRS